MNNTITRKDAVNAVIGQTAPKDPEKELAEAEAELARVNVKGRSEYFSLRKKWSGWIIFWIATLIFFNVIITLAVGMEWLSYKGYEWFITAVIVQTFLEIVSLGAIAVAYLFKDSPNY